MLVHNRAGFVAVVDVLQLEAEFIVIDGDPLFDGLAGWLDWIRLPIETTISQTNSSAPRLHRCAASSASSRARLLPRAPL